MLFGRLVLFEWGVWSSIWIFCALISYHTVPVKSLSTTLLTRRVEGSPINANVSTNCCEWSHQRAIQVGNQSQRTPPLGAPLALKYKWITDVRSENVSPVNVHGGESGRYFFVSDMQIRWESSVCTSQPAINLSHRIFQLCGECICERFLMHFFYMIRNFL